jgi:hypothetical protein
MMIDLRPLCDQPAPPASGDALVLPTGVTVDAQGRLVIVDAGANLVRILPAGSDESLHF